MSSYIAVNPSPAVSAKTDIVEKVRPVLERHRPRIDFAYLFGSTLYGQKRPLGDVDIAVHVADEKGGNLLDVKFTLYADFSRALKRNDIDVVVINSTKNLFLLENIVREGLVIFETAEGKIRRKDFELKVRHQAIDFKDQRLKIMGR